MTIGRQIGRILMGFLPVLATAAVASAQVFTGTVSGTVKDAQGGVMPGVTVVLLNEAQGTRGAAVVTNQDGDFVIPGVTAGTTRWKYR